MSKHQPSTELVKWEPQPSPFVRFPEPGSYEARDRGKQPSDEEWEEVDAEIVDETTDETKQNEGKGESSDYHKARADAAERMAKIAIGVLADKIQGPQARPSRESKEPAPTTFVAGRRGPSSTHKVEKGHIVPDPDIMTIIEKGLIMSDAPTEFEPITRKSTAPTWKTKVPPDHAHADIPETPIDPALNRKAIIATGTLPEVKPVFLRLRESWLDSRIARKQRKIEKLAPEAKTMQFVGKSIVEHKNYQHSEAPLRPTTLRERTLARLAHNLMEIGHERGGMAAQIALSGYGGATGNTDFKQAHLNLSRPERRNNKKSERLYNRLVAESHRRDKWFSQVVSWPHHRAEKLIRQRDKLVRKHEAIRRLIPKELEVSSGTIFIPGDYDLPEAAEKIIVKRASEVTPFEDPQAVVMPGGIFTRPNDPTRRRLITNVYTARGVGMASVHIEGEDTLRDMFISQLKRRIDKGLLVPVDTKK